MAQVASRRLTADEFFELAPQYRRSELIRGEVVQLTPAGGQHGMVAARIGARLLVHVDAHELGYVLAAETGFVLATNPDTVRAPDAAFVSNQRLGGQRPPKKFVPFAPDLVVEVVSPDERPKQIREKVGEWFAAGTRRVWVLYPGLATVHVYRSPSEVQILGRGDTLTGEDVLPGFSCPVAELFL